MSESKAQHLEHELLSPPDDGITQGVRLYDARKNAFQHKYDHKAGVLDCCFSDDDTKAFSGGLDRNVMMCDFKSGRSTVLGSHEAAVRSVNYSAITSSVFSGGWDCKLNHWDPRAHKALTSSTVPSEGGKIYSMDVRGNRLVVATSNRQVIVYDTRNMSTPDQVRESSLAHQTRCVRIFPDATGYALSSIEGRVAIEYFDPSPSAQKNKYAFKCHRVNKGKQQVLYPVNAIAYHPKHGTFATGGCDGFINIWDGKNKKRITQYTAYPTSIAALSFNYDGSLLAIAASYTFEEGEKDHPQDAVFIRTIADSEVKPKLKADDKSAGSSSSSSSSSS